MSLPEEREKTEALSSGEQPFATAMLLADAAFVESRILRGIAAVLLSVFATGLATALGSFLLWIAWFVGVGAICAYGVYEALRSRAKFEDLAKLRADLKRDMEKQLARAEIAAEKQLTREPQDFGGEASVNAFDEAEASRSMLRLAEASEFGQHR